MADAVENSTIFSDPSLNKYYQNFLRVLPQEKIEYSPITYQEQTMEGLSDQISKYLRSYYDKSINARKAQTVQNNAAIDVDAASRGMTNSTWLTDAKNRQYMSEASDIAGLESDYASKLAENTYNQYNTYLANKLQADTQNAANKIEVDKWNSQARIAYEQLAYQRALEERARVNAAAAAASASSRRRSGSPKGSDDGLYADDIVYVWDAKSSQKGPVATGYVNFNDVSSSKKTSSAGGGATRYTQYR